MTFATLLHELLEYLGEYLLLSSLWFWWATGDTGKTAFVSRSSPQGKVLFFSWSWRDQTVVAALMLWVLRWN
jgi:hypothetical protein